MSQRPNALRSPGFDMQRIEHGRSLHRTRCTANEDGSNERSCTLCSAVYSNILQIAIPRHLQSLSKRGVGVWKYIQCITMANWHFVFAVYQYCQYWKYWRHVSISIIYCVCEYIDGWLKGATWLHQQMVEGCTCSKETFPKTQQKASQ